MGSSCCGAAETDPTRIHEDTDSAPGLTQIRKQLCGELWCRLAAIAPIDLTPGLGTSICQGCSPKKKKKRKERKKNSWKTTAVLQAKVTLINRSVTIGMEGMVRIAEITKKKLGLLIFPFVLLLFRVYGNFQARGYQSCSCRPMPQPQQCQI